MISLSPHMQSGDSMIKSTWEITSTIIPLLFQWCQQFVFFCYPLHSIINHLLIQLPLTWCCKTWRGRAARWCWISVEMSGGWRVWGGVGWMLCCLQCCLHWSHLEEMKDEVCHQDWCDEASVSSIHDVVPQGYMVCYHRIFVLTIHNYQIKEERFPNTYHVISLNIISLNIIISYHIISYHRLVVTRHNIPCCCLCQVYLDSSLLRLM